MIPKFPYTNFHEMNLDWVLEEIKNLREFVENLPLLPAPEAGDNGKLLEVVNDRWAISGQVPDLVNNFRERIETLEFIVQNHSQDIDEMRQTINELWAGMTAMADALDSVNRKVVEPNGTI